MIFSTYLAHIIENAMNLAISMKHHYITPEHILAAITAQDDFEAVMKKNNYKLEELMFSIYMELKQVETHTKKASLPVWSDQYKEMFRTAGETMIQERRKFMNLTDILVSILNLKDSAAAYYLAMSADMNIDKLIDDIETYFDENVKDDGIVFDDSEELPDGPLEELDRKTMENFAQMLEDVTRHDNIRRITPDEYDRFDDEEEFEPTDWKQMVTCISDESAEHAPLIGREEELDRTIEVLCRMEKNNPLHLGDPGVGKTAIIYGLAEKLKDYRYTPARLRDRKIYGVELSSLIAGSQFRGDFEKKLKAIMEGAAKEHAILYIDEIHNIIGAGKGAEGGPDAANIMKPYLQGNEVSFIGATTYKEYEKTIANQPSIVRRFQTIDIMEPSVDETVKIVQGLQKVYQGFHNVVYRKDVLEYAVRMAAKHISGRCLPDKAIDLVDEVGAHLEVHRKNKYKPDNEKEYVTRADIDDILVKVCKIHADILKEDGNERLATIQQSILSEIFGQDEAVEKLTEAVWMAKAGLTDEDKPMASLLFVGPTGVGKTEVARVLSKQLDMPLVRFDMSEYAEKHSIAKLIGSPAGYIGYDDGGLLTGAVSKTPNCILLLDEIEKAHSDIYDILLQVMDYAKLSDNKGKKADFRKVILIMTSNAGAQYAAQASVGFGGGPTKGEAMMKQVKKTFKPEFINRLTDIVVFNDMSRQMAEMILRKKLGNLYAKLSARSVKADISDEAFDEILKRGFTPEYGAREIDRVIGRDIKPLFTREILFGSLTKGGECSIDITDGKFVIELQKKKLSKAKAKTKIR